MSESVANQAELFAPLTLRGVTLRNRIGVSPMCQYWVKEGMPGDWHLVHLGSRAVGGAGLVIAEATAVEPRGRISPEDTGIWSDQHADAWKRVASFVKEYGAVAGIQIAHAGRKASTFAPWQRKGMDVNVPEAEGGWLPVAPSPIPFRNGSVTPKELTVAEIKGIQQRFREATSRARAAGFEFLEIHGAHGYLAHSFHSPLSNHRQDEYGGSFENRIRFTLETVRLVRSEWPDHLPLSVRLSCSDWVEGGWTIADSIELSKLLKAEGVDLIDASSGYGVPGVRYPVAPGWQVPFAAAIRRDANIPTAAVGMITEAAQANDIIANNEADIVLLASEMLRDAYWPFHAAQKLGKLDALPMPGPYDYVIRR
jgi:2,4-dienoyl-CoA reductase-like NADH-dependent reductase (Old Yellow Enzyme family)